MLKTRIIPTLLSNGVALVKGEAFDSWRSVGTLMPAIRVFNSRDVDELMLLDVSARSERRACDPSIAEDAAAAARVPIAVGGGVTNVDDMRRLLASGADKVVLNSASLADPFLIDQCARRFGSQCVVASVDARLIDGAYQCVSNSGRVLTGRDPVEWAREIEGRGAGEIVICRVEFDGTMKGYDLNLISLVAETVNLPVIASGGAGSYQDFLNAIQQAGASAVAAGAMFQFTDATPKGAKEFLAAREVPVRSAYSVPS